MSRYIIGPPVARPTRFAGLGYRMDAPGLWRFVDTETESAIGAQYPTKAELLADADHFATERGYQ